MPVEATEQREEETEQGERLREARRLEKRLHVVQSDVEVLIKIVQRLDRTVCEARDMAQSNHFEVIGGLWFIVALGLTSGVLWRVFRL